MTKTERAIEGGKQQVDRFARWMSDRIDGAPNFDDVRDMASEKSRQTVEQARDRVEDFGRWLGDLAVEMNVIEPPKKKNSQKVAAGIAVTAVAAGGWYFFNPKTGKVRRLRLRNYVAGLRDRIVGRVGGAEVFVDENGDLNVVPDRPLDGLEGVSVNG